jgi:hypothetical protein
MFLMSLTLTGFSQPINKEIRIRYIKFLYILLIQFTFNLRVIILFKNKNENN